MAVSHPETWTCVVCGATDVHGANKWARIKSYNRGWYSTRDEQMRFCPAHCPPFAANHPANIVARSVEKMTGEQ